MVLHKALGQTERNHVFQAMLLVTFLCLPMMGFASDGKLTLAWNSNTEPDIAGYRLYYGTNPGSYSAHTDVGLNTIYTMQGLKQGTYYFAITALNRSGEESSYSNEVSYTAP